MKYNELFRLLKNHGWKEKQGRGKGSHMVLEHDEREDTLIVPKHSAKEVKKGLLKAILKQTGIKTGKR